MSTRFRGASLQCSLIALNGTVQYACQTLALEVDPHQPDVLRKCFPLEWATSDRHGRPLDVDDGCME